jgi:t-SNARE complex subunit (syntaxin)
MQQLMTIQSVSGAYHDAMNVYNIIIIIIYTIVAVTSQPMFVCEVASGTSLIDAC